MYFVFIVNDIKYGDVTLTGQEIADLLLEKGIWLFTPRSSNLQKFKVGDNVVIYVAGKGNRYFYASFNVAGEISNHNLAGDDVKTRALLDVFELSCPIEKINVFVNRVPISGILKKLDFIADKRNYGLYFRHSTKVITEEDYLLIAEGQVK